MPAAAPPPTGLPVEACVEDLRRVLAEPGVAVLQAEPGAGKTTVVPLRLLGEAWMGRGKIVVLEPRRVVTRAAARRMAYLLGQEVGATVGYRTREERRVGPTTRIEVVTEGILTRRIQQDPTLAGVSLLIFDEFHERNLQSDLALAFTLDVRRALRPDLRVLIMSATIDTTRVAALFAHGDGGGAEPGVPAPVITSPGRTFPIEVRWLPPTDETALAANTAQATLAALGQGDGDVLVFLPGAAEIRAVAARLSGASIPNVDVRQLFGALPAAAQDAALSAAPGGRRKVVLATDIAETSLTVEGVRIVVDAGLARSPRYDPRTGLTRLRTGPASRASADQRAGRSGRSAPGIVYRLWSERDHGRRAAWAEPEILAVDLAGLALELALWGARPAELAFLDQPPAAPMAEAVGLLERLGGLDHDGRPTETGRRMASLPLHPRLARMVVDAATQGPAAGWLACGLAALLEDRDILRPSAGPGRGSGGAGGPSHPTVDIVERVRLLDAGDGARTLGSAGADGPATLAARRRAGELRRRMRLATQRQGTERPGTERPGTERPETERPDLTATGRVLALAYPDRIAQARRLGRFRLRSGTAAAVPAGDAMALEPFLVVADLEVTGGDGRIRLAASLDLADLEAVAGSEVETITTVAWDPERDDLRARRERRLGALVLSSLDGPARPGPDTTAALLDRVRQSELEALRWTPAAATLRRRAQLAREVLGDHWPDLSTATLSGELEDWLGPLLAHGTSRQDLEAVDVNQALRRMLGSARLAELDRELPRAVVLAGGRNVPISYEEERPSIAVRVQDLFGTTTHPTIARGRLPLVVQLLSPAGRPVQITSDLPGFWAGTWSVVRREMAGRYPKHAWPVDPTVSPPPRRRRG